MEYGDFEYITFGTEIFITGYSGNDSCIKIPQYINGLPVVSIDNFTFNNCNSLKSITLPTSINDIGQFAFKDCPNLKIIKIPFRLKYLLENVFKPNIEIFYYGCSVEVSIKINFFKNRLNNSFSNLLLLEQLEKLLESATYSDEIEKEVLKTFNKILKKQPVSNLISLLNRLSENSNISWESTDNNELFELVNKIKNKTLQPKFVQEITVSENIEFEPKNNQNTYQNIEENDSFNSGCGCIAIIFGIIALVVLIYTALPFFGVIIIFFLMALFSK